MSNEMKIWEVEDDTGKVYKIEGPVDATPDELFEVVSSQLSPTETNVQAPATPQSPTEQAAGPVSVSAPDIPQGNAILNTPEEEVATRAFEEVPGAREYLEEMVWSDASFEDIRDNFAQKFPGVRIADTVTPAQLAEIRALAQTPQGRQFYSENSPVAPVNRSTGIADPDTPDSITGEFGQSALRSLANMANTVTGAAGLAADLVGADETAESLLDTYLEKQAAIQQNYPSGAGQAMDIEDANDAGMWGASVLGELIPQLTASMGAGAVGGAITKKAVERGVRDMVEDQVANGMSREAAEEMAAAAIQKKVMGGQIAGAGAVSEVQSTGAVYGDTYGETGDRKPWASLLAGTAAASLDTILPAKLLGKLGGDISETAVTSSLVKRLGKDGASSFLIEGGTEALQSVIEQLPAGKSIDWEQVVESALRGGFGGGVAGTAVAGVNEFRRSTPQPDVPSVEPYPDFEGPKVVAPTTTQRRTKAYREEIAQTSQSIADRINHRTAMWENAPQFTVENNFSNIPGIDRNAIGAIVGDKVVINAENVLKQAKARNVTPEVIVDSITFHEGLGHHGLQQLFGESLDMQLAKILDSSEVYRSRVEKWLKKNPKAYKDDANQDIRALEEILAERSERGQLPASIVNQFKNMVKDFGRRIGLDIEYSTREVETILGMAHAAVISGKGRDVAANGYKFMNIGENAVLSPDQKDNLELAKAFEADPDQPFNMQGIHTSTKWWKDQDGGWRTRVSDSESGFLPAADGNTAAINDIGNPEKDYNLEEVFYHPVLFEAYPFLEGIKVLEVAGEDAPLGVAMPPSKKYPYGWIGINLEKDHDAESTLLHEIQHIIQEYEGWAKGGNPDSALQDTLKPAEVIPAAFKVYEHLDSLIEEKNSEFEELFLEPKTKENIKKLGALNDYLKKLETTAENYAKALQNKDVKKLTKLLKASSPIKYEAYEWLMGEIEARETQALRHVGQEQLDNVAHGVGAVEGKHPEYVRIVQGKKSRKSASMPGEYIPRPKPNDNNKYMMLTDPDKIVLTPEEIAAMTPEELMESENAMQILESMTEGYTPIVMSLDDLKKEAEDRNLPVSRVLRNNGVGAGEIVKRLYMYDIAMSKLNDRVTTLFEKLQTADFTPDDKANYLKTVFKMNELAGRIFEDQGEVGRALAAMKSIQFTRRRVEGVQQTLAQFKNGSPFEALNDPEEFYKFALSIQDQIEAGKAKAKEKGAEVIGNAINLPRALMSSMDFSAPLRQGVFLIHKAAWWRSFFNMFRYAGSKKAYDDLMESITARPSYHEMVQGNLALSNLGNKLTQREEAFMSTWAERLPVVGKLVRASERAYVGFLNKLRADVFDQLLKQLPEQPTKKQLRDIAAFVNAASGRGNLPKTLQSSTPLLNGLFFSPRLMASRIKMTTVLGDPRTYTTMDKVARKEYIKSIMAVGSTALLITSLLAMGGAEVEKDPRSSDFAKLKYGNTRYDILGGESQYITLGARLVRNSYKTTDGKVKPYGTQFGQTNRFDALTKFLTNKAAPIPSFVIEYLRGVDPVGKKFKMDEAIVKRFVPMFITDVMENIKEEGLEGGLKTAPGMLGVGVQTYSSVSLDTERELEPPETFEMEDAEDGEYNNATALDGTVTLDEEAQKEWGRRLNFYYKEWMKDETSSPEWKTLTDDERREIIAEVRRDARKEAKLDMLEILGLSYEEEE